MELAVTVDAELGARRIIVQAEPRLRLQVGHAEADETCDGPERSPWQVPLEPEAYAKRLYAVVAQHLGQPLDLADHEHLSPGDARIELLGAAFQLFRVGKFQLLRWRLERLFPTGVSVERVLRGPDDLPTTVVRPRPHTGPLALLVGAPKIDPLHFDALPRVIAALTRRVAGDPDDGLARIDVIAAELVAEHERQSEISEEGDVNVELDFLAPWEPVTLLPQALLDDC